MFLEVTLPPSRAKGMILEAIPICSQADPCRVCRKLGVVGLILADGANMALRVLYCLYFIASASASILELAGDMMLL